VDGAARDELERQVRRRCEAGDVEGAATETVRGYGPEVYSLLCALHRDENAASDVFSVFSENLWRGLPAFAWQCTLRTWAYTIARNASRRYLRGVRRDRQSVPLSDTSAIERVAAQVRTQTRSWIRTETKDRFARLRESLPPEEQMLLVLRVDRELEWNELARVLSDDEAPDDATLKREAARLRKRFQLVKEKLVEMARREGLLPSADG
jgi:RNA polymerase sigma-70 factor (ECF subfamily)